MANTYYYVTYYGWIYGPRRRGVISALKYCTNVYLYIITVVIYYYDICIPRFILLSHQTSTRRNALFSEMQPLHGAVENRLWTK